MAEDAELPESGAAEALEQANPEAVSIALGRSSRGAGKAMDAEATAFLRDQRRLINLQAEHLHEQRDLQLAHLRVRRWKDRMSLVLQALGLVVGAAAAVALGMLVWQAREDHGLVVEPFSVPPDMAQHGVTGQVMAAKLLDKLTGMQAQTDSQRAPSTIANNWSDDIKLEIPDTGVSIGEVNRYLRQWLGHQTRVSGELLRTPSGVSLTVRAQGAEGQTVQAAETDLDSLAQQAAEAIYRQTQPYRYGVYLRGQNRGEEAQKVFARLAASGPPGERAWGYLGLGNADRDLQGAQAGLDTMRIAARTAPWMFLAEQNIGDIEEELGRTEAALVDHRAAMKLLDRADHGGIRPEMADNTRRRLQSGMDVEAGDYASAIRRRTDVVAFGRQGYLGSTSALLVEADLGGHDLSAARAALNPGDTATISPARATLDNLKAAMSIAAAAGDWPAVLGVQAQSDQLTARSPGLRRSILVQLTPMAAEAKARMGDPAGAEAMIAPTPADCDQCLRARGRIAALKHDWTGAARWFEAASRQAPSIPFADRDWGAMLLGKGDADGAIARLAEARRKGPHFADPMELWGEALMMKGDFAAAAARFEAADKAAPRWGRNHLLWGEALLRHGDAAGARNQFQTAAGLDLSAADRAALNVFLVRLKGAA